MDRVAPFERLQSRAGASRSRITDDFCIEINVQMAAVTKCLFEFSAKCLV